MKLRRDLLAVGARAALALLRREPVKDSPSGPGYSKPDAWEYTRNEIKNDPDSMTLMWGRSVVPTTYTVEAMHHACAHPLGTLYYSWNMDNSIGIRYMIVADKFRGCGIGKVLVKALLDYAGSQHPKHRVITARVNEFSGPVLQDLGFTYDPGLDCWVWDPSKVKT